MIPLRALPLLILGLTLSAWGQASSGNASTTPPSIADGVYIGLEPMPSESPEIPDQLWYHENTIVVKAGELILDKNPVGIRDGEKSYSASDGGFITYRGRLLTKKGRLYVSLRPFRSDYVLFSIGPSSCEAYSQVDTFPVKVTEKGFWINGVLYTSGTLETDTLKGLENELNSEPFEYSGKHPYHGGSRLPRCEPNDLSILDD